MGKLTVFLLIIGAGTCSAQGLEYVPEYDLNDDGTIDQEDIFLIQRHWHTSEPTPTPSPIGVNINEIRTDQSGPDMDEYFELRGTPSASLDNLTYIVIGDGAAGSGVIEEVVPLDGYVIPASGFFVAAEPSFSLGTADLTVDLNFENGDNVTHVLVQTFSGSDGDDLDTDDDGVLDITPWTDIVDLIALIVEENPPAGTEFHYGPPTVGPDGSFAPPQVYRCPDGTGAWLIGQYDATAGGDTPGAGNNCPP